MPSRNIGWSSTARIRIKLGSVLMILFRSLTEDPETGPGDYFICDRSGNVQLYLRAGSEFTPDRQFRSDLFGALADSWQAPVPGTSAVFNDAWVHALSIVAEAQTKRFAIGDIRLDMSSLCVAKSIS